MDCCGEQTAGNSLSFQRKSQDAAERWSRKVQMFVGKFHVKRALGIGVDGTANPARSIRAIALNLAGEGMSERQLHRRCEMS